MPWFILFQKNVKTLGTKLRPRLFRVTFTMVQHGSPGPRPMPSQQPWASRARPGRLRPRRLPISTPWLGPFEPWPRWYHSITKKGVLYRWYWQIVAIIHPPVGDDSSHVLRSIYADIGDRMGLLISVFPHWVGIAALATSQTTYCVRLSGMNLQQMFLSKFPKACNVFFVVS